MTDTAQHTRACDMEADCTAFPSHIGEKGYIYCASHAVDRRESGYERTRKMRPWELRWIAAGKPLPTYRLGPEPTDGASAPKLAADNAALLAALEAIEAAYGDGEAYIGRNTRMAHVMDQTRAAITLAKASA